MDWIGFSSGYCVSTALRVDIFLMIIIIIIFVKSESDKILHTVCNSLGNIKWKRLKLSMNDKKMVLMPR